MTEPPNKKLRQSVIGNFFSKSRSVKDNLVSESPPLISPDDKSKLLTDKTVIVSDDSEKESILVIPDSQEESPAPSEFNSQHISEVDDSEEELIRQYSSNPKPTINRSKPNLPAESTPAASTSACNERSGPSGSPVFDSSVSDSELLMAEKMSSEATVSYSTDSQAMSPAPPSISLQNIPALPTCDAPREVLVNTSHHTVFVNTPTVAGDVPTPSGSEYVDSWDDHHVKMPCSIRNLYPLQDNGDTGGSSLKDRWAIVENALMQPMNSTYDIEEAILSYNTRYSNSWNFANLHQAFSDLMTADERDKFFSSTLPSMVQLAISLPNLIKKGIPLLKQGSTQSLTFSQQQVASIVSNSFFCTWPKRNAKKRSSEFGDYPAINMNGMFAEARSSRNVAIRHKIKCIITYFTSITEHMPTGCVTYTRYHFDPVSSTDWAESQKPLSDICFTADQLIEDAEGLIQADFANMRIGGGVMRTGCVQEEIQFVVHPELLASGLFTERLNDNEVFIVKGVERFSYYYGYSDNFRFSAPYSDTTARDSIGRRYRHIVAMDATRFTQPITQYQPNCVIREVNKAYGAFTADQAHPTIGVSTGNWGCGAFRGNHKFKALIQLMAASECSRPLFYTVFGDKALRDELQSFHALMQNKNVTVGCLWKMIADYGTEVVGSTARQSQLSMNIVQFIKNKILK